MVPKIPAGFTMSKCLAISDAEPGHVDKTINEPLCEIFLTNALNDCPMTFFSTSCSANL